MNKKLLVGGIILYFLPTLMQLGIFVTFPQMTAYAVSKDTMQLVLDKLDTIDRKIDAISLERK